MIMLLLLVEDSIVERDSLPADTLRFLSKESFFFGCWTRQEQAANVKMYVRFKLRAGAVAISPLW